MKNNSSIAYIGRKSEIILSPYNENNPTFIYTKYSVKRNKVTVPCGDHGGFSVSEGNECLELVCWVLRLGDLMSTKRCFTGLCFVQCMSGFFILSFLAYRYHDMKITRSTGH